MIDTQFDIKIKEINAEQLEELLVENTKTLGINARPFDVFNISGKEQQLPTSKYGLYNDGKGYLITKVVLRMGGNSFGEINFNKINKKKPLIVGIIIYKDQNVFDENELPEYTGAIRDLVSDSKV